jgi:hypothetical protein
MMRLLVKGFAALFVSLAALVSGTHGLAYDSVYFDGLRAFLLPTNDCTAPCFLGIRPGVTTQDEAVTLLRASSWAQDIEVHRDSIEWRWNDYLAPYVTPQGIQPQAWIDDSGRVQRIVVISKVAFGDIWMLMGKPDGGEFSHRHNALGGSGFVEFSLFAAYQRAYLETRVLGRCPGSSLWQATSTLIWWSASPLYPPYNVLLHPADRSEC